VLPPILKIIYDKNANIRHNDLFWVRTVVRPTELNASILNGRA
jgi:hypothetical protein